MLQGGSGSGSGSQGSFRQRFGSQGSFRRERSYIGRVRSNDSLSRHQWGPMPSGSFVSRTRSHHSMDRLQEELDPGDIPSDDIVPTPLDQMHDITEELTTQLTGGTGTLPTTDGDSSRHACETDSSSPNPDHGDTDGTVGQCSKGGDESGLQFASQNNSISFFGVSNGARRASDADSEIRAGNSSSTVGLNTSPLRDSIMRPFPLQQSETAENPAGEAVSSDAALDQVPDSEEKSGEAVSEAMHSTAAADVVKTSSVELKPSGNVQNSIDACESLNVQSAAVRDENQECEKGEEARFGPETEHLLGQVKEVVKAIDGGPFGAASSPVKDSEPVYFSEE